MEIDWNIIWSAVTAISTLVMAIAAWQAKNSFIKQRGYEDYLKITELLDNCQNKILFLPSELADNSYRKTYTEQMTDSINKINRMIKSAQNYLSKNKMLELSLLYKEILKFHTQLIQESCNYEGLESPHMVSFENSYFSCCVGRFAHMPSFTHIVTVNAGTGKSE